MRITQYICVPHEIKARGGDVDLVYLGAQVDGGRGYEVLAAAWQQLVTAHSVKGELRNHAVQVDLTSGQYLPNEFIVVAHVDDAVFAGCREAECAVAGDHGAAVGEHDVRDVRQLAFHALVHLAGCDRLECRQFVAGRKDRNIGDAIGTYLKESVVFAERSRHGQLVAGLRVGPTVLRPLPTGVQRDAGGLVLEVADDAEVAVGSHDARDGHGLTHAVVGARVEDVRLAPSSKCCEAEEGGEEVFHAVMR